MEYGSAYDDDYDFEELPKELYTQDLTYSEKDPALFYGPAVTMGFISTMGLIFNAVVILVICALQDYRKTSHWYVLNLALADSFFLLMLPLHMTEHFLEHWPFGLPLCVTYNIAFYVNYYSGILFLTVMSFDRYVAILHPMSTTWRKFRNGKGCKTITLLVWIMAILFAMPLLLRIRLRGLTPAPDQTKQFQCILDFDTAAEENITTEEIDYGVSGHGFLEYSFEELELYGEEPIQCAHEQPHEYYLIWIKINFVFAFVVPIIAMCICYGCILWRVLHPRIPARGSDGSRDSGKSFLKRGNSTKKHRNNLRVTMLVVSLIVAFVLCWAPFHITQLAKIGGISGLSTSGCKKLDFFALTLAYSNSFWNPVLYTFMGANFHKRVSKVWKRIRTRNATTREILASFKNKKRNNNYAGFRASSASKNTKTTDSIVSVPTSNIYVQVPSRMCGDEKTFSTTEFKE